MNIIIYTPEKVLYHIIFNIIYIGHVHHILHAALSKMRYIMNMKHI